MSSFINDEKGVMEPYTDLPAMALAVIGFMIFIGILSGAYSSYQEKAFIAEHYQDAGNLALKLSRDISLTGPGRPDTIDASLIEEIKNKPDEILQKYGTHYNMVFKVETFSEGREYRWVIKKQGISYDKNGISASLPVTVRINDVKELPGTLTVKIWEK